MQSFITEQYNRLSVHVMPTSQYANCYLHLSIMNEQGRIPSALFAVIVRLLFRQDSLGKRKLQQQLWSMYADELSCELEQKGETQLASIRLRIPAGVLPRTEARTLEALKLLADMLFEPSLNKGGFDFDEAQIQEELAWAEHHAGYDVSNWDKVVRGRSLEWLGYAGRSRDAGLEQLQHGARDGELQEWYREVLCSPLHIHVIGDFQSDVMIAQVMETFLPSVMEAERGVTPSVIGHGHQPTERREEGEIMLELMDVQQCKINVAFTTGVTYGSSDYPALFLFHSLFGATPASRLQFELREVNQWVYQIYSTLDDYRGTLHVTTGTSSGYVTEVLEAIDAEWLRICSGDIQELELNRAIQNVMHYVQVGYDLPEQVVNLHIDRLLNRVQMTTPQFLEAISCVTAEQVAEVASGMKRAVTWILYPESEYSATEQEVNHE